MARIIAHQVFAEILDIARSDDPIPERREKAEKRIAQLKTDLKRARLREAESRKNLKTQLTRHLRNAFDNPDLPPDERIVFLEALDALAGFKR